jgi:DNA-binding transcriptional MocR family regulator
VSDDLQVKLAVYRSFAETGRRPSLEDVAARTGVSAREVLQAYGRLRAQRVLVLEADGASIRMAPPFSGVETQHVVESDGISYFANCAWDSFGIPAALQRPATVLSRCEQSMEPLSLRVGLNGPEGPESRAGWLFHCAVPAAHWWDDIVFT